MDLGFDAGKNRILRLLKRKKKNTVFKMFKKLSKCKNTKFMIEKLSQSSEIHRQFLFVLGFSGHMWLPPPLKSTIDLHYGLKL